MICRARTAGCEPAISAAGARSDLAVWEARGEPGRRKGERWPRRRRICAALLCPSRRLPTCPPTGRPARRRAAAPAAASEQLILLPPLRPTARREAVDPHGAGPSRLSASAPGTSTPTSTLILMPRPRSPLILSPTPTPTSSLQSGMPSPLRSSHGMKTLKKLSVSTSPSRRCFMTLPPASPTRMSRLPALPTDGIQRLRPTEMQAAPTARLSSSNQARTRMHPRDTSRRNRGWKSSSNTRCTTSALTNSQRHQPAVIAAWHEHLCCSMTRRTCMNASGSRSAATQRCEHTPLTRKTLNSNALGKREKGRHPNRFSAQRRRMTSRQSPWQSDAPMYMQPSQHPISISRQIRSTWLQKKRMKIASAKSLMHKQRCRT